jgi:hypothetical protein
MSKRGGVEPPARSPQVIAAALAQNEAKLAAAKANRERADRELGVARRVEAEIEDGENGDDDTPVQPGQPAIGSPEYYRGRLRKGGRSRSRRRRSSKRGGVDPPRPRGDLTLRFPPPPPTPTLRNPPGPEVVQKPVDPKVLAGLDQYRSPRAGRRTRRRHPRRKTSRR